MTDKAKQQQVGREFTASSVFGSEFLRNKLRSLFSLMFYIDDNKNCLSRANKSGNLLCPLNQPKISVFNLNNIINYCYANELPDCKVNDWFMPASEREYFSFLRNELFFHRKQFVTSRNDMFKRRVLINQLRQRLIQRLWWPSWWSLSESRRHLAVFLMHKLMQMWMSVISANYTFDDKKDIYIPIRGSVQARRPIR